MKIVKLTCIMLMYSSAIFAQDVFSEQRGAWLKEAEVNVPRLSKQIKHPLRLVTLKSDSSAYQFWKTEPVAPVDSLYISSFKRQSGVVVDFGEHITGYITLKVDQLGKPVDAPIRLKLTFGEVPAEIAMPYDPYPGTLSRAWIQDEVIDILEVPAMITIPRRLAFRYMKAELLGSSGFSDFRLSEVFAKTVTSALTVPSQLAPDTDSLISQIDQIGLTTLKECMQTVFEDGPKRDQRLWMGDFYLQSLTNNYSFKNYRLTKRCLYLFAGLTKEDGSVCSNLFEKPEPHSQNAVMYDYAMLYNVTLKDYFQASGDKKTTLDLWPVALKQVEIAKACINADGTIDFSALSQVGFPFFDWRKGFDRQASIMGLTIFSLQQTRELAKMIGKEKEVAELPALIGKMRKIARTKFLDQEKGLFVSGSRKQVSYGSQAWMILADVATKEEAALAFNSLHKETKVVNPGTPYMWHYVIEAMIKSGLDDEARETILNIWGGMVNKGADTFWEVYDPKDDFLSPYKFAPLNSYCHAWSCTPAYFIRKYPEIFQN